MLIPPLQPKMVCGVGGVGGGGATLAYQAEAFRLEKKVGRTKEAHV